VYTIVAGNGGPSAVAGAIVADVLPASLLGPSWNCVPSSGSSCTAAGSGNINDVVSLAIGGTATYTVTASLDPAATGTLSNTVTVSAPAGTIDPDPVNDSATDVDTLTPEADLAVSKTDTADPVSPGAPLGYALAIANAGPSNATAVTVIDTLPAGVVFGSSNPGPPTCSFAAGTLTCALGPLAAGSGSAVTIDTTVTAGTGILVNTANVSGAEPDADPSDNSDTETTLVGRGAGELAHGTDAVHDLAAPPGPAADEDIFRISQKPYSSYEVIVDATSGDIGSGDGPLVDRVAPDLATVLQSSSPVGTGSSRSLRWINTTAAVIEDQAVRVRSAQCGTDCGPDDVYRIRAYETTYTVPRFNNSGTQITVLVVQNPTDHPVGGQVYLRNGAGAVVATAPLALSPRATLVLNTSTVPGASGVSGTITIAHDGRYGELSGKTVALEPETGFSFDSALEPRVR
jgi:uncharacterized repeat protein (TIGR01451 family)